MKITLIIISYRSLEKLKNCIKKIGPNIKIVIIENSDDKNIKHEIEKNYQNCKVILNGSCKGFAKASNIGFKEISSDFAFLLQPDVEIRENQIFEIENLTNELNDDFTLASPISEDYIDFYKNNKIDNFFKKDEVFFDPQKKFTKVNLVKGSSLLVNLKKFDNKEIFDNNFFFFFEEIDLCRRIIKKKENIFVFNQIKVEHKSGQSLPQELSLKYDNFRNWNYFWSRFYYFKKHYGLLFSFRKHVGKLFRFGFNLIRFYFISKPKFNKNKYRFLGLVLSMIGKDASRSIGILEK